MFEFNYFDPTHFSLLICNHKHQVNNHLCNLLIHPKETQTTVYM